MRKVVSGFALFVLVIISAGVRSEVVELPADALDHRAVVIAPDRDAKEYNQLSPTLSPVALKSFEQRAELEDPVALDVVFFAHLSGLGCPADTNIASEWLDKAWRAGTPLGVLYRGRTLLGLEANSTDKNAAYGKSLVQAARWDFLDDAKRGNAASQFFVGVCCESLEDSVGAFSWYARAAEQGFLPAKFHVAYGLLHGIGTATNVDKGLALLTECATQNLIQAQDHLGELYADGFIVARNDALALQWSKRAGSRGSAPSQFRVGMMYAQGRGVLVDTGFAAEWFELAAEQGHAPSQVKLADYYAFRRGLPDEDEVASNWYLKAAEQHNADAAARLGARYAEGRGLRLDPLESRLWLNRATELQLAHAATPKPAPRNYSASVIENENDDTMHAIEVAVHGFDVLAREKR